MRSPLPRASLPIPSFMMKHGNIAGARHASSAWIGVRDAMKLAGLFVVAAFAVPPALAMAETPVLSPFGYGPIQFGQPLEAAEPNLNETALPKKRKPACDFVKFARYPRIRFMVEEGIVTRADAKAGIRNSAEIGAESSLATIRAMHPGIRIVPHKYDDEGHYLILDSPDGGSAILFEERKGKLAGVRAGEKPSVEYVEGCL
jgi:hypothetical protein